MAFIEFISSSVLCIFPRTCERDKRIEAEDAGAVENEEGVERKDGEHAGKHTDLNKHIKPVRIQG